MKFLPKENGASIINMALREVDSEPVIARLDRKHDHWTPRTFVRLHSKSVLIASTEDYWHCL